MAERAQFGGGSQRAIHLFPVIMRKPHVEAGKGGDGARRAEQLHIRASVAAKIGSQTAQMGLHARLHPRIGCKAGRRIAGVQQLGFGERYHAPGHADPVFHGVAVALWPVAVLIEIPPLDQHEFGGAAADIEYQRAAAFHVDKRLAAQHGKAGFFGRCDHIKRQAGFIIDALDKIGAIFGPSAGFGRHRSHLANPPPCQLFSAGGKCNQRAVHRRVGKPT